MRCAIRLFLGSLLLCCVASARAELVADPVEVDFWRVSIGFTSEPMYVTLRNTGNTSLTVVDLWAPSGQAAYARAGGTCGTAPFTLAAQASCTLGYTFTPSLIGRVTQTLRATPDVGSFVTFRLVGEGEVGGLVSGPSLFFGLHAVGDTAGPLFISLSNTSASSLTVVSLTTASAPYARVAGTCGTVPFTLASQASCTLGYTFTPSSIGEVRRDLTATPNVGAADTFSLTGEGAVGSLRLDPIFTLRFMPPIPVGAMSEPEFVTLRNVGPVRMRVTAIAPFQVPPVQSFFRTGGTCDEPPFFLNSFASCTVGYTFMPAVVGETQLDMRFQHNVGSAESVTLSGEGLPGNEVFANGFEDL
jgi:hypothetical protein